MISYPDFAGVRCIRIVLPETCHRCDNMTIDNVASPHFRQYFSGFSKVPDLESTVSPFEFRCEPK